YSGGAEAVEAALRLAKAATAKAEVVGFWGGFHGKTGGVLPLLGSDFKHHLGPFMPGRYLSPYADCYRCPLKLRYPDCGIACAEFVPDVMTVGKGVGGGFPLSGVISTDAITAATPWANPSASSSSYGGNPLAAAAGLAALEIIVKEDLVTNAARVGKVMLQRLEALKEKYRCVGEVRGKGLMLGIELVTDRTTKAPVAKTVTQALYQECLRRGLVAMTYSPSIRINPPLVIREEQALAGLAIL